MEIKPKKLPDQLLTVMKTKNVLVTVVIGNAQIGSSRLKFEEETDAVATGKIKNQSVGTGRDLPGKKLNIITRVLDSNPRNNKISIKHIFHYEDGREIFILDETDNEVDNNMDIFSLEVSYQFTH